MSTPTISEQIFEDYLSAHGVEFERIPEGDVPSPDYRLYVRQHPLIVEVKELNRPRTPQLSNYYSVAPIREKIRATRRKFDQYQNLECCLVLYNHETIGPIEPEHLLRAMFGEQHDALGPNIHRFSGRAELGFHQNTRFSAVASLWPFCVRPHVFESLREVFGITLRGALAEYNQLEARYQTSGGPDYDKTLVRVVVVENPFARKPLSRSVFNGPLDERWARDEDGSFRRVFSGEAINELRSTLPDYALRMIGL
jgi:hypothetical protein